MYPAYISRMPELWGLLALSLGMTLVPGIDTAMVLRVTLQDGRRDGLLTAAGCATGLFVHAAAVAVGLAALVAASAAAYQALKLAGAVFLVVVGVLTIAGTFRPERRRARAPRLELARHPFALGLLTNLGNPKALLFFLSVLPQFLDGTDAALPTALAVAVIPVACSLGGLSLWAIATGRLRDLLGTPRARRAQERVLGTVLVALGLRVALEPDG
jgi:threonine/homoserine/homoserine lactone efflux protein